MWKKLKTLLEDKLIYLSLLVVLVALGSFGLGRLSVQSQSIQPTMAQNKASIALVASNIASSSTNKAETESTEDVVVASKNGTKYHLTTCPGAKQISEKNKISFSSVQAAEAAGYEPAANCKF